MDEILKSIYLKLNSNTRTLTKSAISQILVKIIYSENRSMRKLEIVDAYKKLTNRKNIDQDMLGEVLDSLCANSEIQKHGPEYSLSSNKRRKIAQACQESQQCIEYILDHYFSGLNTDKDILHSWLIDVTIRFFSLYADEWISDLVKPQNALTHSENSIRETIKKRTINYSGIDKSDVERLPILFYNCITTREAHVESFLWEYGTSSFSAKLISNIAGVDNLTLESFKNSKCILDTNVLMFIALESSHFHKAFESLEKVFESLGVTVGALYITKKEYQDTIYSQAKATKRNLEKLGYELTALPNDDFTQSAISLGCRKEEDFDDFFDHIKDIPSYIFDHVSIIDFDYSSELKEHIETSQADKNKLEKLNAIYKDATGHEKRTNALRHDVGLLAGAEYLRKDEKFFILSEEVSINNYSKNKGIINNLPLAIRVETLINVLALNHGGTDFEASDYVSLFASIIRNGLQPKSETFKQEELYRMYLMNEEIAELPAERTKEIVFDIHHKMLKGVSEDELKRDLANQITKGKLCVSDELEEIKLKLSHAATEGKRQKDRGDKYEGALYQTFYREEVKKYNRELVFNTIIRGVVLPAIIILVSFIVYQIIISNYNTIQDNATAFIISIVANLFFQWLYWSTFGGWRKICSRFKNKKSVIESRCIKRMAEINQ